MKNASPDTLKTKPHFEILDGLRGVAALSIVFFHFMEIVYTDNSTNFIGHGFLAVDFFFCLSGFVIGYAYDNRIQKTGVREFLKSRVIRLHPLVILGSVLGLITFFFDPFVGHPGSFSTVNTILLFICSIFLVPAPMMAERYFNLFSFNAPAWSLFWEYVASILYGLFLYRIGRKFLIVLVLVSAAALCFVCYRAGSLLGGWSGGTFWDGSARIAFSFLAGLLVYRSNWVIKTKLGFGILSVLLFAAFIIPFSSLNWITEPFVVLLYFPLIISLGAGASLSSAAKRICVFSGKISYPLYMTHYSAMWMFGNYYASHKPGTAQLALIIPACMLLLLGMAYIAMVFYDTPIRNYFTSKRKRPQ